MMTGSNNTFEAFVTPTANHAKINRTRIAARTCFVRMRCRRWLIHRASGATAAADEMEDEGERRR